MAGERQGAAAAVVFHQTEETPCPGAGVPTQCCPLEDSLRSNCHKLQDLPEATWNNNKTMPHARLEDVEARAANHVRLCA